MSKKDSRLFLIFSIMVMVSLMLALTPTSDFDQDGAFDSLITEGLLLVPLMSSVIRYVQQDQFPAAKFANPRIFSLTFIHPPVSA